MKLYDIDKQLEALVDPETGEISDNEAFDRLQMARKDKLEGVALWIKNLKSDAEALKKEEESFRKRRKSAENQLNRLKDWLAYALEGNPFETERCKISYHSSSSVEVEDEEELIRWARESGRTDLLRIPAPEVARSALKEAIDKGEDIPFCHVDEHCSIIVK